MQAQEDTLPSLEQLLDIEVTSAGKKAQRLGDTTTAIEVITAEQIRRSGARSIPELLRDIPGVQVERTGAGQWAVSIRGTNTRYSNKLLVLIDGRSIYTPIYSGVAWEVQDTLIEDIERIEVIRGPGGTLWGLNAVNGVINIVTRPANGTVGGLVTAATGDKLDYRIGVRYGWRIGDDSYLRAYAKTQRVDAFELEDGATARDDWSATRVGLRADGYLRGGQRWTALAESVSGVYGLTTQRSSAMSPSFIRSQARQSNRQSHVLGRIESGGEASHGWSAQIYAERINEDGYILGHTLETTDLELQRRWQLGTRQDVIAGFNHRRVQVAFDDRALLLGGRDQEQKASSAFIQNDMVLLPDRLRATFGVRWIDGQNSTNWLPNARVSWSVHPQHQLWGAWSKSTRLPSIYEKTITLPAFALPVSQPFPTLLIGSFNANPTLGAENLRALEAGYRFDPETQWLMDVAAYRMDYTDLVVVVPGAVQFDAASGVLRLPLTPQNVGSGASRGLEVKLALVPKDGFQASLTFALADNDIDAPPGAIAVGTHLGTRDPWAKRSATAHLGWDASDAWRFDAWLRHRSSVPAVRNLLTLAEESLPTLTTLDLRAAWHPQPGLEIGLSAQGLGADTKVQFLGEPIVAPVAVGPQWQVELRYEF